MKNKSQQFILWFDQLNNKDVNLVGGKNASLGEMYQKLTKKGVKIPNGFAVTAYAYQYFLKQAGIDKKIKQIFKNLDTKNLAQLARKGEKVRQTIMSAEIPKEIEDEIIMAYEKLSRFYKVGNLDVAVRSSATAEDLPTASFAGQQESFLNIRGEHSLLNSVQKCIASLFTDRAISYRVDKGFDHFKVYLSVSIQKMVRSDKSSAGVSFTLDTETGFSDVVLINSSYGLGESVVKGKVNPDAFFVFKPTLKKGFYPIISKRIGSKDEKVVYNPGTGIPTKDVDVSVEDQVKQSLSDKDIIKIAEWSVLIEDHYKKPMDIEWAKDGNDKQLYIVQARPETVHSQREKDQLLEYKLEKTGKIITTGISIGSKIGVGKANVIKDASEIQKFKPNQVLVTEMTDPDWEPVMKMASAIVTNSGGRTCHAAIVSRELGIPCIVGTKNATTKIKQNKPVTISCAEGEDGFIYEGILPFKIKRTNIKNLKRPKAKIMMNIGLPDKAFASSFIPNDGVGLARVEFIINDEVKIHPLALINYSKLKKDIKDQINEITTGYKDKKQFFIDKLAFGIGTIAAAFYPKDVIVRLSDFKTNEYANLIGGEQFEPQEANPMLGWRGASRYYDPKFRPAFDLECKALKKVRDKMGLKNVKIMVPFCRTVEEGKKVIAIMKKNGLNREKNGLEIYVMCEIPSNVISADQFAKIFDGFSIGSNDLTQLALGVDRDSALVSHVYDERNQAVKDLIKQVIQTAHKYKRKVGICGQAPSDFEDFAVFLDKNKIDSISLIPDTVLKTTRKLSTT